MPLTRSMRLDTFRLVKSPALVLSPSPMTPYRSRTAYYKIILLHEAARTT